MGGDTLCSGPGGKVSSAERMLGWGRAVSPASRGTGFLQSSAKAAHRRKAFQISKMPRCGRRLQRPEGASQPWE